MVIKTSGSTRMQDNGELVNVWTGGSFGQSYQYSNVVNNTVWAGEHLRALQQSTGNKAGGGEISVAHIPILQNGTLRFSLYAWSSVNNGGYVRLYRWRDSGTTLVYAPGYAQTSGITFMTDQWVEYGDRFIWNISGVSQWEEVPGPKGGSNTKLVHHTLYSYNAAVYTNDDSRFDAGAFLASNRPDKFAYNG